MFDIVSEAVLPVIDVHPVRPSSDVIQEIVPVLPAKDNVILFVGEQTEELEGEIVPTVGIGTTVNVKVGAVIAVVHPPVAVIETKVYTVVTVGVTVIGELLV